MAGGSAAYNSDGRLRPVSDLTFERRGVTWVCGYKDRSSWPVILIARSVYPGTARLVTTLTLGRALDGAPTLGVLTEKVDLLVHAQCARFAHTAAARLQNGSGSDLGTVQRAIESMIDGLQEQLLAYQTEADILDATEIDVPADPTPLYAVWPFVPSSRAGMLVGPKGAGKSTTVQAGGLSVVTGRLFLPRVEPRVQGPVIYIGQEEDAAQWAARLQMICSGYGIERPRHYHYMQLRNSSLIESAEIVAEQAANKRAVLVIIDSAQATWGSADDQVRDYATRWFNAVKQIGVPAWVVDHPNRSESKNGGTNGNSVSAAGTSVKEDRVGHWWAMKSVEIPVPDGTPHRYHVTLSDGGRNYVARQPDIEYEVLHRGYDWVRFEEAGPLALSLPAISSALFRKLAATMRQNGAQAEWSEAQLADRIGRSTRQIHDALRDGLEWRRSVDGEYEERIVCVQQGGGRGRASQYALETRQPPVTMGSAPGADEGMVQ